MTELVSDARLREIAAGEYGPDDDGGYAPNEEEGKAIAAELLAARSTLRCVAPFTDERLRRIRANAVPFLDERGLSAPVFDSLEGRERGGIADVVVSCDPGSLVTIKDFALIDEAPGISVGFIVDAAGVKALKERVQEQAAVDAGLLRPTSSPAAAPPDGCQMMIARKTMLGDGLMLGEPCGATPTVGGNGPYRYCEAHMRVAFAAGATTLVRDGDERLGLRQLLSARSDVVMVAKIDPREPRTLYDSAGRKIGEVMIDGDTGTARITDPEIAEAAKAAAGRGFSMGYRVTLEPVPAEPRKPGGSR